ncbi:MAG: sigma-70 family RNA polymerase sigma factor [Taibaiella sp.]
MYRNIEKDKLHTLIQGCMRGEAPMQREFYYFYFPVLMRLAVRYAPSREDAEQWVHDAFLKIFGSLDKYENLGSFEGWIKKITVRVCLDNLRKNSAQKNEIEMNTVYTDYDLADQAGYINNEVVSKMSAEGLLALLNTLPEKQKTVFNLHVFEDYSHKEIAALLHITENNSYWLLHQARKNLKENISVSNKKKELCHE